MSDFYELNETDAKLDAAYAIWQLVSEPAAAGRLGVRPDDVLDKYPGIKNIMRRKAEETLATAIVCEEFGITEGPGSVADIKSTMPAPVE